MGPPLSRGDIALVAADPATVRAAQTDHDTWGPWLERALHDDSVVYFSIQAGDELVGEIFLHDIAAHTTSAMLGYHIFAPARRGRGIGTAALAVLIGWLDEETAISTLFVTTGEDNGASRRLLERAGMTLIGRPRENPDRVLYRRDRPPGARPATCSVTAVASSELFCDYDFHPDEPVCRLFRTPPGGVAPLDDGVLVTEATHPGGVVLRHVTFADRWYKINVTTDRQGAVIETGDPPHRFAFNCDIATPLVLADHCAYAVDLFIDVLVKADGRSYEVTDEDEFTEMVAGGIISPREATAARAGLDQLLAIIEAGGLVDWLSSIAPFGPTSPPDALPMLGVEVPPRLLPHHRPTW